MLDANHKDESALSAKVYEKVVNHRNENALSAEGDKGDITFDKLWINSAKIWQKRNCCILILDTNGL
ncbi:hypothetical protein PanWU01x14_291650 [Parasponia andersonii]|uniref:Uncharacterized protein n=1 Tax=Parasponia andersonii TaxID=3476 RepID=A0A2P5AXC9_PARAD|nr:hypothetical protein PanWU01x14_291650 [Parasponia andersonii]